MFIDIETNLQMLIKINQYEGFEFRNKNNEVGNLV